MRRSSLLAGLGAALLVLALLSYADVRLPVGAGTDADAKPQKGCTPVL